jgi:hypothetical protein
VVRYARLEGGLALNVQTEDERVRDATLVEQMTAESALLLQNRCQSVDGLDGVNPARRVKKGKEEG